MNTESPPGRACKSRSFTKTLLHSKHFNKLDFFSETALLARHIPLYQGKNSFSTDLGEKTVGNGVHFIVWIAECGRGGGLPQRASHLVSLCALIEYLTLLSYKLEFQVGHEVFYTLTCQV